MKQFRIHGSGSEQLQGELPVFGAKNHVLKLIPAAFLSKGESVIHNVPEIEDVHRLLEIVENIGCSVKRSGDRSVTIMPPETFSGELPSHLVPTLRASVVLLGPLLARYGAVTLPHPGGDNIGRRPINFFIDSLSSMGATVEEKDGQYHFTAKKGLTGATIYFPQSSVTATETIVMAAVLAKGETIIHNAATEPEVVALASYLQSLGAHITGIGTHTIIIQGGELLPGGTETVLPDRIEAGSFVMLAAATNSNIVVTQCRPSDLEIPLALLARCGVDMRISDNTIEVHPSKKPLQAIDIVTHEYPGFPTDLQAPMTILLTQAEGDSMIHETLYEGRLLYTELLKTFGASISLLDPHRALVHGRTPLEGHTVESPDVRAGIALVMAGLIATGETIIQNIYHIDRGYERIEERLQSVGATISREQL